MKVILNEQVKVGLPVEVFLKDQIKSNAHRSEDSAGVGFLSASFGVWGILFVRAKRIETVNRWEPLESTVLLHQSSIAHLCLHVRPT